MVLRFYIDDGDQHDLRVAEILERYGFRGIFYIAPYNPMVKVMTPFQIRDLANRGHEIGGHSLTHRVLTKLSSGDRKDEISEGKTVLEEIIGKSVTKFAYPRGWYNKEVAEDVKRCGFSEARTMSQGSVQIMDTDGNFEIPVSVHCYPVKFQEWKLRWQAAKDWEASGNATGYFGVVCHGWELEKYGMWDEYEAMVKQIAQDL